MRDYKKDIKINTDDLETTWLEQPSLMLYYNDLYASAIFTRDKYKVKADYIIAKLDSRIRKNYKKFGFTKKPTEPAIKNTILLQPEYQKVMKAMLHASKQANLMSGIRTSFEHRKKALENLVSLHITGFHSEPRNKTMDIKELQVKNNHKVQKQGLKRKRSKELKNSNAGQKA